MSAEQEKKYQQVIQANIAVHSQLAAVYSTTEPHFRPENIAIVDGHVKKAVEETRGSSLLDLGCGTGFVIDIAKHHVKRIVGVDVTKAMLSKVDTKSKDGTAAIELHEHDTGTFPAKPGDFDVVTAYSFLHHLFDVRPTFATAAKALKQGGVFYADLDPNFYFWDAVAKLEGSGNYDPIVQREIDHVNHKDEDIQREHGIDKDVFNDAEYGKNIAGGFKEEVLREQLTSVGFTNIVFHYYWFLGQAFMVNDESVGGRSREDRIASAKLTDAVLQRVMPLSRQLYKYLGFTARKA
jgi:ubiquinone/menaquinone biosynthesis C-methylase UbiE